MTHSKGISWIDDCRIPFVDEDTLTRDFKVGGTTLGAGQYGLNDGRKTKPTNKLEGTLWENTQGRFPANILVCDDMLNDGVITKVQDNLKEQTKQYKGGNFGGGSVKNNFYFGDKGSSSRYYNIDKWFDKIINYE
jgi:hypothetical protein